MFCVRISLVAMALASVLITTAAAPVLAIDSTQVKALLANPPREYSSAPLWVWNDMLTDEEVVGTLRDLAAQNVKQAIVHPRPGLMTPYLSPEWFRLFKVALREAERLDMNLWIYDENSYPSGFAGGLVPDAMPESRGRGLALKESKTPPAWSDASVAMFRLDGRKFENVSEKVRGGEKLPEGSYLAYSVVRAPDAAWTGGKCYVDLLYPGVTEKFLSITHDAYAREIGEAFGKRVPGVFTDEPELRPAGHLPWTPGLPDLFQKRWGYSLLDNLPCLSREVGDFKHVRHNYFQLLSEQFIEHWGKPYHDWCETHHLQLTGHYWEHEWPRCISVPDNMAMYAWHQCPAIDILMNQYSEDVHAQFGNARAVRELASVANQLGRQRTLCEAYGAGGWDLRFEDMKRIGDWMYALGVNTLDQHLSYVTIRGARKHDHPQSFSYHEPWWEAYNVSATYFARLSAAISQGEQRNPVLVIEPTTTAWLYNSDPMGPTAAKIGAAFQSLINDLERQQVEYDIGCEDILARHGSVAGLRAGPHTPGLTVGKRTYLTVVLPPMTENLNSATADLLAQFSEIGTVLCCGDPPALIEGQPSDRITKLAVGPHWKKVQPGEVAEVLRKPVESSGLLVGWKIERAGDDKGLLFHQRRVLSDGQILFLVNTSLEAPSAGRIVSHAAAGVEQWDLNTGRAAPYAFKATGSGVEAEFQLPPAGSLLLFLSKEKREPAPPQTGKTTTIEPAGPPAVRRTQPNVLTLDYVDITAGGETQKDTYVLRARDFAFKKNGLDRDPWDRAVQFKDQLITHKFPPGSGFEATYKFTIQERVPAALWIVIERPDLYTITCNGKPVSAGKEWWLDKAFGRLDIAAAAQVGENAVTLKAAPITMYHELDCAYVLGDFALQSAEKGFVITPPKDLQLGAWNAQGHPFYATGVAYTEKFDVPAIAGRWVVAVPKWYGSVAKVTVNGKPAGYIAWQPWECDVTSLIRSGSNEVEVLVIGTLKNTLGPHHGKPPLGTAWPGMWDNAPKTPPPGSEYSAVGYGLLAPFTLQQTK